jgi:hypothetical protein
MHRATRIHAVLGLIFLALPAVVALAAPPVAGLQPNSLQIKSQGRRYRPQRNTFSPYISLSPGSLGNLSGVTYFAVVRPEIQQLQINQEQFSALQKLAGNGPGPATEEDEVVNAASRRQSEGFMTHHKYFAQPINRSAIKKPGQQ